MVGLKTARRDGMMWWIATGASGTGGRVVGGPTRVSGGLDAGVNVWLVLLTGWWVVSGFEDKVCKREGWLAERQRESRGGYRGM